MYNILRLFCENLKAIEVKLMEIYTIVRLRPTVRTAAATTSYLITCETLNGLTSIHPNVETPK